MEEDGPRSDDEFNAFLEKATADDQEKTEVEMAFNQLEVRLRSALKELGYESLSSDRNTRRAWTEYLVRDPNDTEEMARAKTEELDIRAVLTVWGMMEIGNDEEASAAELETMQRSMKIGIYALLLEKADYTPESPLLKVTNKLLPGGTVSLEDDDYIEAAKTVRDAEDEENRKVQALISDAYNATDIGVFEDSDTAERMADDVMKIVSVVYIQSLVSEPDSVAWHAKREAMIRERASEYSIPGKYTDQLVAFFESRDE